MHVSGEYQITTPDGDFIQIEQLKQQQAAAAYAEAQRAAQAAQQAAQQKQQACNQQRGYIASLKATCESKASFVQKTTAQACPPDVTISGEIGNNFGGVGGSINLRTKCIDDARFEYNDAIKLCAADEKINNRLLPAYCY